MTQKQDNETVTHTVTMTFTKDRLEEILSTYVDHYGYNDVVSALCERLTATQLLDVVEELEAFDVLIEGIGV